MKTYAYFIAPAFALAACSSGTTTTPDTVLFAMDEEDTVQAALIAGETVTAKSSLMTAVLVNQETGDSMSIDPLSFSMMLADGVDEDVTIMLDGEEVTFTSADRQLQEDGVTFFGWSQEGDNPRYSLWAWSNSNALAGISPSGDSYVNIWEVFYDDDDGDEYKAYTVSGTETPDTIIAGLGTATYSGYARVKAYPIGSYDGFESIDRLEGDVSMSADFADGSISGAITDLRWGPTSDSDLREDIAGQITMELTMIASDGSYSGALSPNGAFDGNGVVSSTGGTYTGDFFGPAADQTAGVIEMDFEAEGTDYVGTGIYNTFSE